VREVRPGRETRRRCLWCNFCAIFYGDVPDGEYWNGLCRKCEYGQRHVVDADQMQFFERRAQQKSRQSGSQVWLQILPRNANSLEDETADIREFWEK
jgi:hypothetical protein